MGKRHKRRAKNAAFRPRNAVTRTETRISTSEELEAALRAAHMTNSGAHVTERTAMGVAAVYACVRVLAESVSMLPLRLYREASDGSRTIERGHALNRLVYKRPNALMTPLEFKRLMVGTLALRGNFYARKIAVGNASTQQLLPLNPDSVKAEVKNNVVTYTHHQPNGTKRVYSAEEIMHVRGLSTDGFMGISILQAAAQSMGLSITAEEHGARTFSNGANPGGMLKHPGNMSAEAAERLKNSFDERHSGAGNAGKTILLEEGLSWEKVGMTSEESQFVETRKFQRSEIAMFFGVPPHMIGDIERGTSWGSGIEQQSLGFVTYTLRPWLVNIAQAFERDLIPEADQDALEFGWDTEALANIDFVALNNGLKTQYDAGALSRDEWRRRHGLNPRPDGRGGFIDENNAPQRLRNAA